MGKIFCGFRRSHAHPADVDGAFGNVRDVVKALAGTDGDALDRTIRHARPDVGRVVDETVQQASAARHDNAVRENIADEFRRRPFNDGADRFDHRREGFFERVGNLMGMDPHHTGKALDQAASLDVEITGFFSGPRGADFDLDFFRRPFADENVVLPADITDDGFVELVTRHLDGFGDDHAAEGQHRDVGGAAADVNDHMTVGRGDIDARTDGGSHRFLDEVGALGARLGRSVHNGAFFHFGDAGGNADDDAGLEDDGTAARALDKVLDHAERDLVLADDAVAERAHRRDIAGSTAEHHLCFAAELEDFVCIFIDCNNGGFSDHDPLTFDIHEDRGSPEVNSDVFAHSVITRTFRLEIQVKTLL